MTPRRSPLVALIPGLFTGLALALAAAPSLAVDADSALALARAQNCFKCHAIEKKKEGPSFKETAAKYKGKAEALDKVIHHLTSGEKAKFPDGHEEEHKIVKRDPAEIKNLAEWVLSQ